MATPPVWRSLKGRSRIMAEHKHMHKLINDGSFPQVSELAFVQDQVRVWQFKLHNFVNGQPGGAQLNQDLAALKQRYGQDYILMEILFPDDYPTQPFFLRVVRPRMVMYTGHVTAGGSICIESLTLSGRPSGWQSYYSVETVLLEVLSNMIDSPVVYIQTPTGPGGLTGPLRIDLNQGLWEYGLHEAKSAFARTEANHHTVGWGKAIALSPPTEVDDGQTSQPAKKTTPTEPVSAAATQEAKQVTPAKPAAPATTQQPNKAHLSVPAVPATTQQAKAATPMKPAVPATTRQDKTASATKAAGRKASRHPKRASLSKPTIIRSPRNAKKTPATRSAMKTISQQLKKVPITGAGVKKTARKPKKTAAKRFAARKKAQPAKKTAATQTTANKAAVKPKKRTATQTAVSKAAGPSKKTAAAQSTATKAAGKARKTAAAHTGVSTTVQTLKNKVAGVTKAARSSNKTAAIHTGISKATQTLKKKVAGVSKAARNFKKTAAIHIGVGKAALTLKKKTPVVSKAPRISKKAAAPHMGLGKRPQQSKKRTAAQPIVGETSRQLKKQKTDKYAETNKKLTLEAAIKQARKALVDAATARGYVEPPNHWALCRVTANGQTTLIDMPVANATKVENDDVMELQCNGMTKQQAVKALKAAHGNLEQALITWLATSGILSGDGKASTVASKAVSAKASAVAIASLLKLGLTPSEARFLSQMFGGDVKPAAQWVASVGLKTAKADIARKMKAEQKKIQDEVKAVRKGFEGNGGMTTDRILRIQRVQNLSVWTRYHNYMAKFKTDERQVFHGTSQSSATAIAATGFDIRFSRNGPQLWFASSSSHSHGYSYQKSGYAVSWSPAQAAPKTDCHLVMLLCKVTGGFNVSYATPGNVFTINHNDQAYPDYVIHYKWGQ